MPSTEAILFDMGITRIRREASEIYCLSHALSINKVSAEISDLFDLKWSAAQLRHAADYLDNIRRKLEPKIIAHD